MNTQDISFGGSSGGGGLAPGNDIVWLSGAGVPTDGVAGTGVGVAGPGSRYTDTNTNIEYRQHGTLNDVLWQAIHAP